MYFCFALLIKASCLIVAILLHYFFMAAFSWMLCEGLFLFITLYFVFYNGFFKHKKFFFAVGWGKKNLIMYACSYLRTYVCCMNVCAYVHNYACMYACMCVCMHVYVCMYACITYVHMDVRINITHLCMLVCMHVYHLRLHAYICNCDWI